MILQNSSVTTQTLPGVFDRPNDDQDGGTLTFEFVQPVELQSIVLVDIDQGSGEMSSVTLTDGVGETRVYTVPPEWTGDRLVDGTLGWQTLDLLRSTPQIGFHSTTTVDETLAFDPRNVMRLDVHLGSSGAIDDVRFTPICRLR